MLVRVFHAGWLLAVAVLFLAAGVFSAARFWIPELEAYRQEIEIAASRALQHEVTFGALPATLQGINPALRLENVVIAGEGEHRLARLELHRQAD